MWASALALLLVSINKGQKSLFSALIFSLQIPPLPPAHTHSHSHSHTHTHTYTHTHTHTHTHIHRSVNEVICHGIPDGRELEDGDICNGTCVLLMIKIHL